MKILTKITSISLLAFVALLMGGSTFQSAQAVEKEVAIIIPDTSAAIWKSIDSEVTETSNLIQAGTLKDLHRHAFAIRDLVAALPDHSASLPVDKLTKVKSDGKFVATIADRLDAAGDGGDKTAAAANFEKLKNILNMLQTNYPESKPAEQK